MNLFEWPLWILLGTGTAFAFLAMQYWSVQQITPEKPFASKALVIGGAFIRWVLIFLILALALNRSIAAALVVFATFMVSRLIILFVWQRKWQLSVVQSNSNKD